MDGWNGVRIFSVCLFHNSCLFKLEDPAGVDSNCMTALEFIGVRIAAVQILGFLPSDSVILAHLNV